MRPLADRLKSRKLWMAIAAAVIAGLRIIYPDIPANAVETVIMACLGYVTAEAVIDATAQLTKWLATKKTGGENV